eukprot:gene6136-8460_t
MTLRIAYKSSKSGLHCSKSSLHAEILNCDTDGLTRAADNLVKGELVAFPTETVYGLGANALNETAVKQIFVAKGRPTSDPLIVHILNPNDIESLVTFESHLARRIFEILSLKFWPGPLTIIHKASSKIPKLVTSNTGYVGTRSPSHIIARQLLEKCGLPLAAPSANKFGHVSPTSAKHVFDDLHNENITILEDNIIKTGGCRVGIESTVCKISQDGTEVSILRCGIITKNEMQTALSEHGITHDACQVHVNNEAALKKKELASAQAPGQMIKHYSPDIPTYIVTFNKLWLQSNSRSLYQSYIFDQYKSSMVIDYGGILSQLKVNCLVYKDLSALADPEQACVHVFSALRDAESNDSKLKGVTHVLLPDLSDVAESNEVIRALWERLNRAASATWVKIEL